MGSDDNLEKNRIDKWLHAARFFKTRSLASEAIERGRVTINGNKIKPAKQLALGDSVVMRIGNNHYEVTVLGLSNRRGSATEAQKLYRETDESKKQRELLAARLKEQPVSFYTKGRPTKRDRRNIERFFSNQEDS
ncbi:MAG TPA: RNA-binding S4 domain-containing protein [Nitrosomonas sp.]|nr:RNA-binding S4 domain-containing protein [Nitrosomonas sp.]HQX13073.1 RNA-binding S4 domain-containing protein [Nitrosomonas sp.]HRB20508.1 RNA-binding S4 domain-containing protein [Nitrosomonas sp.]HRB32737.1 RNA-binding S4 domain-containing protein [Nitrosomonas sp.]HRB45136.1 RNA-binding S4 domain-containing protein [Nitrosomonas sp.]